MAETLVSESYSETEALLKAYTEEYQRNPDDFSLELSVLSLRKRLEKIKHSFAQEIGKANMANGHIHTGDFTLLEGAQSTFDVMLIEAGNKKINVMKVIWQATGIGLKETIELVDTAPRLVKAGTSKDEADKLKAELEAEGAKVTIK